MYIYHTVERKSKERWIEKLLFTAAGITILTTIGIVSVLLFEGLDFFQQVSVWEFLTDKEWTPLFTNKHFGIMPLLAGTLLTSVIAIAVAIPFGLSIAKKV